MATVLRNARVMTCDPAREGLGIVEGGVVVLDGELVRWVGPQARLDAACPRSDGDIEIDLHGRLVTPGLVDCHTHAIFAGDRANEFAMRAAGRSYLDIAAAGGGIQATLVPTRAAGEQQLVESLVARLAEARSYGTTTMEIKSGYDLTADGEARLLRCIAAANVASPTTIVPTLLAHLVPAERAGDRAAFVAEIRDRWIPEARGVATSVDVYCDEGAFTREETAELWASARRNGLGVRGHIGQFRDLGGAELVGELAGLSGDHLEQVSDAGITAMARAGTVAVMLPGACVQLRLPAPPIAKLRAAGVAMAIATDFNPGSSCSLSLPIQMWLATTHFAMSVDEAWLGVTRHAATALGLATERGRIAAGCAGDIVVWNCHDHAEVPYRYGSNLVDGVYIAGSRV